VKHRAVISSLVATATTAMLLAGCGGGGSVSAPATSSGASERTVSAATAAKPTVVIVHGAFADASGWNDVIGRLRRAGYPVIAPANPLRGVKADAAYIKSVLATVPGPVVLVGHSYAGAVITNAAVGARNVKALVYLAAIAPEDGESQMDIFARFPGSHIGPSTTLTRPFPGGVDVYIDAKSFRDVFAADQSPAVAATMAATQRPLAQVASEEKSGPPAWRTLPSWFMVAKNDHAIPPAAERFMAKRAHAHTVEVASSHDVMVSHPAAVTNLILDAARTTSSSRGTDASR
jgi:pimeloyl-ACP methyl ester carboxylesterase